MDNDYIRKIEADVAEIKADVKKLMLFMAVEKAKDSKNSKYISGIISLIVSLVVLGIGKVL